MGPDSGAQGCHARRALEVGPFSPDDTTFGPHQIQLVPTSDGLVTAVFVNGGSYPDLGQLTFDGFGDWPSALPAPTRLALPATGGPLAAGSVANGGVTLLFAASVFPALDLRWIPQLLPVDTNPTVEVIAKDAAFACLALGSGERHLLGYWKDSAHRLIRVGKERTTRNVGCLRVAFTCAQALATDTGFLIAVPSAEASGNCGPEKELPRVIQMYSWDDEDAPTLRDEWSTPGWIASLEILPRSDGAWVVWREAPDSGPIVARRVSHAGNSLSEPRIVLEAPKSWGLSAATLADDLVFAVTTPDAHILLRRVEAQGRVVGEWSYGRTPNHVGFASGMLGSSDGRTLLLATSMISGGGYVDPGHLIRWDCTPD